MFVTIIENYKTEIKNQFPKYLSVTDDVFSVIEEMLAINYNDISSDKRKLHTAFEYLQTVLEKAFKEVGSKRYLSSVFDIFLDEEINSYLKIAMKSQGEKFSNKISQIKYEIVYWQGCEGVEHRKLEKILDYLS